MVTLLAATWLSVLAGVCQTVLADEPDCPHCAEPMVMECGDAGPAACMEAEPVVSQDVVGPSRLADLDEALPATGLAYAAPRQVIVCSGAAADDPPAPSIPLYLVFCRFIE